jgi:hypothetical protein
MGIATQIIAEQVAEQAIASDGGGTDWGSGHSHREPCTEEQCKELLADIDFHGKEAQRYALACAACVQAASSLPPELVADAIGACVMGDCFNRDTELNALQTLSASYNERCPGIMEGVTPSDCNKQVIV